MPKASQTLPVKPLKPRKVLSIGGPVAYHDVALFYGFDPIIKPQITKKDAVLAKKIYEIAGLHKSKTQQFAVPLEDKIALIRHLQETEDYDRESFPIHVHTINQEPQTGRSYVDLDIVGTESSVAEAMLIRATNAILSEDGYNDLQLYINSVGDKDSSQKFTRELYNFFKKKSSDLSPSCRQVLKRNVYDALKCDHEKCVLVREEAPRSISFLTEKSRQHFKEVLEFVETFDFPYKIHHPLLGHKAFCSQTIFEVRPMNSESEEKPLAVGLRYDYLGRKMGYRKEIPSIGVRIFLKKAPSTQKVVKTKDPQIGFFHLGYESRLKSLSVLELLRRGNISSFHTLSEEKLSSQMHASQNQNIKYAIIMGQKEALEHAVIVRDMSTREQETVQIPELVGYLRDRIMS